MSAVTRQRTCLVQGRTIGYREAAMSRPRRSSLVCDGRSRLAGAEYDTLIRALTDKYHLIAPDCIGFGASEAPEPGVSPIPSRILGQPAAAFGPTVLQRSS